MPSFKRGVRLLVGLLAAAVLAAGLLPGVTIIQFQLSVFLRALLIIVALHLALVLWDRLQRRSRIGGADRRNLKRPNQG